jgi:hypothetical protein
LRKQKPKQILKARQRRRQQYWTFGFLAAVLLFFALIRIRLLQFPLERDEGEYAYSGQLLLRGIDPYHLCYTMKLPGTAAVYALIVLLFGQTPAGIHFGLVLVNSATIVLLYFLASRFWGNVAGLVAAVSFGLLSAEYVVNGVAGHATHFVVLAAIAGFLVLFRALESRRLHLFFWAGLLFGLAFLMKQPGLFFAIFALLYLAHSRWKPAPQWQALALEAATFCLGCVLPFALTCLAVWATGDASKFWFWVFSYAGKYGSMVRTAEIPNHLWQTGHRVVRKSPLIWLIGASGLIALLWDKKIRKDVFFVGGFVLFSFLAICPGFYFRLHYFILLLPAVSLLCAVAVSSGINLFQERPILRPWAVIFPLLFSFALVFSVIDQHYYFFQADPITACRRIYVGEPFPEAVKVAEYLKSHSAKDDRIAVMGSEPEIYFYSGRLSATGYIYTYPLTEPQPLASTMQREMISEITASHPRFVVLVDVRGSWVNVPNREPDRTLLHWTETYLRGGYELRGVIDMLSEGTEYHWDDAATYQPRAQSRIVVFERAT